MSELLVNTDYLMLSLLFLIKLSENKKKKPMSPLKAPACGSSEHKNFAFTRLCST